MRNGISWKGSLLTVVLLLISMSMLMNIQFV